MRSYERVAVYSCLVISAVALAFSLAALRSPSRQCTGHVVEPANAGDSDSGLSLFELRVSRSRTGTAIAWTVVGVSDNMPAW
jgi:hypothetical protein